MCVWACHVTQYHFNVKNKVVANFTARIEFTYGICSDRVFLMSLHCNSRKVCDKQYVGKVCRQGQFRCVLDFLIYSNLFTFFNL